MTRIFDLLALVYAARSLLIARSVWQNWGQIQSASFTPQQKHLAREASFYLAVPVGVLFHELAHAVAVWLYGGRIVEFGYRVFWGYVLPDRTFPPSQEWFVSLAGTLGSLIFGLALWLILSRNRWPSIRYFALRAFRFQIFFSLVYYPVFTLLGFIGDWRTIYDFNLTPFLSGLTAVAHVGLLGLFWWADRSNWFEMPGFSSIEEQQQFVELEAEAIANPLDDRLQLQLVDAYRRGGLTRKATTQLKAYLKRNPHSAEGHLQLAILSTRNSRRISAAARSSASQALKLGLSKPATIALAHQLLGQYNLDVGRTDEAIDHLSQGLAEAGSAIQPAAIAHLSYLRALAYRRNGQNGAAYQDIQMAVELAERDGNESTSAHYRQVLQPIEGS